MQNTIEWNLDEEHKCFAWDATTLWQRRLVGSPPARAARWPARSDAGRKKRCRQNSLAGQKRYRPGHEMLAGRPETTCRSATIDAVTFLQQTPIEWIFEEHHDYFG